MFVFVTAFAGVARIHAARLIQSQAVIPVVLVVRTIGTIGTLQDRLRQEPRRRDTSEAPPQLREEFTEAALLRTDRRRPTPWRNYHQQIHNATGLN